MTVSRETTRIVEPLRKDGYVDYLTALDRRFREGVTVENNAAVLFWRAMGPREINQQQRDEYFKRLGIPPLSEKGNYYVPSGDCVKRGKNAADTALKGEQEKTWKELAAAMERPWSEKEFPIAAGWLLTNEQALALVVEASKRPRRYDPLISERADMVMTMLLPGPQQHREVARALKARAMLRLNEGNVDQAWNDLLSCHRLARLAGQGPSLVEALVAIAIDGIAADGDYRLVQHARLTAHQAAKMRDDLGNLSPLLEIAEKIDVCERFQFLDSLSSMARDVPASMRMLAARQASSGEGNSLLNLAAKATLDWDQMFRIGNFWYDRFTDAVRKSSRSERQESLRKIDVDLQKLEEATKEPLVLPIPGNTRETVSQRVGEIVVTLLLPAIPAAADAADLATMRFDLARLAFALAAYRADHNAYPGTLTDLVPKYATHVPKDIFSDEEIRYEPQTDGYLLYSVGLDGKDARKKTNDCVKRSERWGLVVRVPATVEKPEKRE